MTTPPYLPHIDLLLQSLRISRDRLDARSKVAVSPRLLVHILRQIAASLPFDEAYYLTAYPDMAAAHNRGEIADLHRHFIESGFFEGRFGADPEVNPDYYIATYPDVGQAISDGHIASAEDHYIQSGAAEGRCPNPELVPQLIHWHSVLHPDA